MINSATENKATTYMIYIGCIALIIYLFLVVLILATQYTTMTVSGDSMEPTLSDGDPLYLKIYHQGQEIPDDSLLILTIDYEGEPLDVVKRYVADQSSETEVYFLGDNEEDSYDSADIGAVPISCVQDIVIENKSVEYINVFTLQDFGYLLTHPGAWVAKFQ
ncbi:MAG: S26 family signal peptidase [Eubacteriales bacterium]